MADLLHPRTTVRSVLRQLRPVAGAIANAADAVRADQAASRRRRSAALSQAHALGPASWAPLAAGPGGHRPAHGLDVCDGDADQLAHLSAYVADGLAAGEVCVVVATRAHLTGLRQRLVLSGLEQQPGRLVEHDAEQLLAALLHDGAPNSDRFDQLVGTPLRALADRGRPVRAYGEMVGLLHARGHADAARALEQLWEQLLTRVDVTLLCAYQLRGDREGAARALSEHHTHTVAPVG